MPAHTFYVDNIYAYVPLPRCKTIYYADIDLYRYFIGREGQSVNEAIMVKRLDQQFRITRIMMEAYHLYEDVEEPRLRNYMMGYFTMMMAILHLIQAFRRSRRTAEPERPVARPKGLRRAHVPPRTLRRDRYGYQPAVQE